MSNILKQLHHLEFPDCTREALDFLVRNYSEHHRSLPGRSGSGEGLALQVAQEYIVDVSRRKGHRHKKLNAFHELQLLEMVCSSLQDAPEHARYTVFSAIFGGHVDQSKITLMTKLVSMAISTSCASVLGCAAIWMQEQGSQSQCVCDLAQRLVEDFCLLYPNIGAPFRNLPAVSTLFTCNFITALTTIYMYTDVSKSPPKAMFSCIVDWISADPCLCSDSVRLVRIRSNFTCPLGGLVRWCILGPLVTASNPNVTSSSSSSSLQSQSLSLQQSPGTSISSVPADAKSDNSKTESDDDLMTLFSKLHLGILVSLQAYKSMELNEHLFTYTDMYVVSKTLAAYYGNGQCSKEILQVLNVCVDRLAQTVQVAFTTGSLSNEFDLRQMCEGLPPNRLLQMIVLKIYGQRQTEAMDLS